MTNRFTHTAKAFPRFMGGLVTASAIAFVPAGCGKDAPPTPAVTDAVVAKTPEKPAEPVSRLSEAQNWDRTAVTTANYGSVLELASALQREGTPAARTAAIRLRLLSVLAMDAKKTLPEGFDVEAQVRQALALAEDGGAVDAPLAKAAAMLLRVLTPEKAEPFDTFAVRALVAEGAADTLPGDLVRVAARKGLVALGAGIVDPVAFADVAARFGNFVCATCHQLGQATAAAAAEIGNGCTADDKSIGCTVSQETEGLAPLFAEPANRFVVALFEELSALASQPLESQGLAEAISVGTPPRTTHLPALTAQQHLSVVGAADKAPTLVAEASNLVAVITSAGLGVGMRPFVKEGGVVPAHAGKMLAEQAIVPFSDLKPEVEGEDSLVVLRLRTLMPDGPVAEEATVAVAIDGAANASSVAEAITALQAAGPTTLRFIALRAGAATPIAAQLPLVAQRLPLSTAIAINSGAEREVMVVVGKDSIDIWGPEGALEATDTSPAVTPVKDDRVGTVPGDYQPGWRATTLARLRLPLPSAPQPEVKEGEVAAPPLAVSLDAATVQKVVAAVAWWREATGSGPVVQVVGGADATAQPVLQVALAIQEARDIKAPLVAKPELVWVGATCGADGCPGQVAVVFAERDVPSDRGLDASPSTKKEAVKPVAPKPEAASPEFCNKNDIQVQMRKNTGRIRFCYEKELQLNNDLKGRVTTRFTIGLDGSVSSLSSSGSLKDKNVVSCVEREVGKMSFAKPVGGACLVSWPFVFGSE